MNSIAKFCSATALAAFALCVFSPGVANAANFAGAWAVRGTLGRPVIASATPECVFRQAGNRIAGACRGPNSAGAAAGAVNGQAIIWQWNITVTNAIGIKGIATFKGVWGRDGVLRGTWTHSARPGVGGVFTALKLG
jgi:hypothetical protein